MKNSTTITQKKRLFIVEDHTILREGLRAILSDEPDFEVVGEAGDGREAIRGISEIKPDLVLMDLSMPVMNGMEAIREIKMRNPDVPILALTVHRTEDYIRAALQAGADGYVLKDATRQELLMAVQSILNGKTYLSPGISQKIVTGFLDTQQQSTRSPKTWDTLTHRERQIIKLIAEGYKNKDIADCLSISPKTVEKHRSNLMKKLDLHSSSQLAVFAMENGILSS